MQNLEMMRQPGLKNLFLHTRLRLQNLIELEHYVQTTSKQVGVVEEWFLEATRCMIHVLIRFRETMPTDKQNKCS